MPWWVSSLHMAFWAENRKGLKLRTSPQFVKILYAFFFAASNVTSLHSRSFVIYAFVDF